MLFRGQDTSSDYGFDVSLFNRHATTISGVRRRFDRTQPFPAHKFLIHRDEVLHIGTIRSDIETPRLLDIDVLLLGYPFVLQEMFGPGCDQHFQPEEMALGEILIKAPAKGAVSQMHQPDRPHQFQKSGAIHGSDLKIDRDRHGAVLGVRRMKHVMIVSRGHGRIEIQLSGKVDLKRERERQA